MRAAYDFKCSIMLRNRTYAPDKIQTKIMDIKLVSHDLDGPFSNLKEMAKVIIDDFDQSQVVSVNDPQMIRLLEPKAGATVHNVLNKLIADLKDAKDYRVLGGPGTIPTETVNAYKVVVVGGGYECTQEGLTQLILDTTKSVADSVSITDDGMTTELSV